MYFAEVVLKTVLLRMRYDPDQGIFSYLPEHNHSRMANELEIAWNNMVNCN